MRTELALVASAVVLAGCAAEQPLDELSGLAASMREPGRYWAVNDDIAPRLLFRLDEAGRVLERVPVRGAFRLDTEALTLYVDGERHWLLLGDIGDNRGMRDHVQVHAVPEPGPGADAVAVAWTIRFRYPDGPRDAEALAVDGPARELLVLTKRDEPARLYSVPLDSPADDAVVSANFVREVPVDGITGFDISPDGMRLAAIAHQRLFRWSRLDGETWRDALAREPDTLDLPLPKAEGVAFSADGTRIVIGSERVAGSLLTLDDSA